MESNNDAPTSIDDELLKTMHNRIMNIHKRKEAFMKINKVTEQFNSIYDKEVSTSEGFDDDGSEEGFDDDVSEEGFDDEISEGGEEGFDDDVSEEGFDDDMSEGGEEGFQEGAKGRRRKKKKGKKKKKKRKGKTKNESPSMRKFRKTMQTISSGLNMAKDFTKFVLDYLPAHFRKLMNDAGVAMTKVHTKDTAIIGNDAREIEKILTGISAVPLTMFILYNWYFVFAYKNAKYNLAATDITGTPMNPLCGRPDLSLRIIQNKTDIFSTIIRFLFTMAIEPLMRVNDGIAEKCKKGPVADLSKGINPLGDIGRAMGSKDLLKNVGALADKAKGINPLGEMGRVMGSKDLLKNIGMDTDDIVLNVKGGNLSSTLSKGLSQGLSDMASNVTNKEDDIRGPSDTEPEPTTTGASSSEKDGWLSKILSILAYPLHVVVNKLLSDKGKTSLKVILAIISVIIVMSSKMSLGSIVSGKLPVIITLYTVVIVGLTYVKQVKNLFQERFDGKINEPSGINLPLSNGFTFANILMFIFYTIIKLVVAAWSIGIGSVLILIYILLHSFLSIFMYKSNGRPGFEKDTFTGLFRDMNLDATKPWVDVDDGFLRNFNLGIGQLTSALIIFVTSVYAMVGHAVYIKTPFNKYMFISILSALSVGSLGAMTFFNDEFINWGNEEKKDVADQE